MQGIVAADAEVVASVSALAAAAAAAVVVAVAAAAAAAAAAEGYVAEEMVCSSCLYLT